VHLISERGQGCRRGLELGDSLFYQEFSCGRLGHDTEMPTGRSVNVQGLKVCWEELFRLRFPDGFACPKFGCREYYPIRTRNTCQCRNCRRQTSVTAGTVMHRTHLPLTAWFWAMYLCATDKRGISASQLSRLLGVCHETAWYLLSHIRTAMRQRDANYALPELVEMQVGKTEHFRCPLKLSINNIQLGWFWI